MGRGRGTGVGLGVGVAVGVAVAVGVGVGPGCAAQYFPPVFRSLPTPARPPQTIISVPVHTAVCLYRAVGTFVMLVAVQLSVLGLYLPPVFKKLLGPLVPPQTIISLPFHTACEHIAQRAR